LCIGLIGLVVLVPPHAAAKAPPGRYQVNAPAGTVHDTFTKLTWQRDGAASGLRTWAEAGSYCSALWLDGPGWRLPTIVELRSIVDLSQEGPAIDPAAFPGTPAKAGGWSSTKVQGNLSYAWYVNFLSGSSGTLAVSGSPPISTCHVRCVR
jgi:hypothetical protein